MSDRATVTPAATVLLTEPGIYDRIAADDYHADPCREPSLSASIAHIICSQSPAHAKHAHPRLNPHFVREAEDKFDLGTAAHAIWLENDKSKIAIIDAPDWRTKDAKEARDKARAAGKTPLLTAQALRVNAMLASLRVQLDQHQDGRAMFTGKAEQTGVWFDDEFDVWCRCRFDGLSPMNIDDYKTTVSANPDQWTRTMFAIGADIQAAFYLRGYRAITGHDATFRFCVQECEPPYAMSVIALGPDVLTLAEKKVRYALETFARCLKANDWPGYPTDTCYASLPAWHEAQWLEKELR